MPYKVVKSGSGYRVKNKHTGKTYSKKPQSKAKAMAQMRAIYANSNESKRRSASLAEKLNAIGKKVIDEWNDGPPHVGWGKILRISHGNEGMAYLLHGTLKGIAQGLDPQSAFDTSVENENFHGDRSDIVSFRRRAAGILRDRFNIAVDYLQEPDPDFAYEQERENRWEDEDYGPDPDFEYDRQREDEGLMGEDVDAIHDIRAEAFRIAEEAHKTGDESYVKELCRQASARFRITIAEMYRMAEAMYNQHFASYT